MKLSAQEEYGLRCLLRIATEYPEGSITIPEIARREELSEPHVAKLLMILRKGGFINSTRGHSGGYSLSKHPREIVIGAVMAELGGRLFEEGFCDRHSGLAPKCVHESECAVRFLWDDLQRAIDAVVYQVTLQNVLDNMQSKTCQDQLIQVGSIDSRIKA